MFTLNTDIGVSDETGSGVTSSTSARENQPTQSSTMQFCLQCERSFTHREFIDHLFDSKECMRKYWQEEEKLHSHRLRRKGKRLKKTPPGNEGDVSQQFPPPPYSSIPR